MGYSPTPEYCTLFTRVVTSVTSPGMDADTQGLASALALLGIYNVADLVELARTGSLVEMILTARWSSKIWTLEA